MNANTMNVRALDDASRPFGIVERWTKARLEGFAVVVACDVAEGSPRARESNRTDLRAGTVYWQTRAWLSHQGLVDVTYPAGRLALMPLGRRIAYSAGLA